MKFKVTIENFEGPIDALLQLIEKHKLPISDISLAEITDEFINFVHSLEQESLSNMTHFIFIASTLTLIKSKSLLPNLDLTNEEEGEIEDLKKRISIFKIFQDLALDLEPSLSKNRNFYYPKPQKMKISFKPHEKITQENLKGLLISVLSEVPIKENSKKEASIRIAVHIDEMMNSLEKRIKKLIKTDFNSFIQKELGDKKEQKTIKIYNVIGFLAMLELVKNGILDVLQKKNFETISLVGSSQSLETKDN